MPTSRRAPIPPRVVLGDQYKEIERIRERESADLACGKFCVKELPALDRALKPARSAALDVIFIRRWARLDRSLRSRLAFRYRGD